MAQDRAQRDLLELERVQRSRRSTPASSRALKSSTRSMPRSLQVIAQFPERELGEVDVDAIVERPVDRGVLF